MTVSRWERGERAPRKAHLIALAALLADGDLASFFRDPETKAAA